MALPQLDIKTFRDAAIGIGAAALVSATSLGLPASQAHAEDARPTAATAEAYSELGLPVAQAPSAERPYHYMRFDAQTKAQYPGSNPIDALPINGDKLVVLNFIDGQNPRFSQMQTQVLEQTLAALAPRSQDKGLMLIDVVVRDAQGNDVNASEFITFYDDNNLGPNGSTLEAAQLPYGLAYGEPVSPNGEYGRLFDFALMNGVKTDADLQANAKGIYGRLYVTIEGYNQKKATASLASNNLILAAN